MSGPARQLPLGAELGEGERGGRVRVWAPTHAKVTLVVEAPARREVVLARGLTGHHSGFVPGLAPGARYRFRLDDDPKLYPDPASRFQPRGPFGPSEVIDPDAFAWTDSAWRGIPAHRHVLYELHVGTFTPEGTYAAAMAYLPYLAELGITTIELMPIAEWAGRYNWGYDGVLPFAPTHNYGRPDDLRRFVDRAHACGLAVILDVVYNHFGPSGNFMFAWSPYYRRAGTNEWGDAINYDGENSTGVRELVTENAGYWIREFHLDGLRLDATQAMIDDSRDHIVAAIVRHAREAGGDRTLFIVAENEPQDIRDLRDGADAIWNDDFHHATRAATTGLVDGYLSDYRGSAQELVSAVKHGFLYQGQIYPWQRNTRGSSTRGLLRTRLVQYLENHDQAANVGFGERLITLTDPATLRAATALLLLAPQLPMLFQGQEHGSRRPWRFFVDHLPELRDAVRRGRAQFVAQFSRLASPEAQDALPDPCDEATFRMCVLDPAARSFDVPLVALHRDLLRLRREEPAIADPRFDAIDGAVLGDRTFVLRYLQPDPSADRLLLVNLGPTYSEAVVPEPLIAPPEGHGWRVVWSSEDPRYGGHGTPAPFTLERLMIPAHASVWLAPDPSLSLREENHERRR